MQRAGPNKNKPVLSSTVAYCIVRLRTKQIRTVSIEDVLLPSLGLKISSKMRSIVKFGLLALTLMIDNFGNSHSDEDWPLNVI